MQILKEQQALLLEGSPLYLASMSQQDEETTVDGLPKRRGTAHGSKQHLPGMHLAEHLEELQGTLPVQ